MKNESIKAELAELKGRIAQLEAYIDMENPIMGHPHVWVPREQAQVWLISPRVGEGNFIANAQFDYNGDFKYAFRTKEAAEAEAHAQNVRMLYRVQPGACAWDIDKWGIYVNNNGTIEILNGLGIAASITSGSFKIRKDAENALAIVGEEATRKAAFHLAGKV